MKLEQVVSDVAGKLLSAETFDAYLSEVLAMLADEFVCDFVGCCIQQGSRRRELGWDRAAGGMRTLGDWPWARRLAPGCVESQAIPDNEHGFSNAIIASVGLESMGSLHLLLAGSTEPVDPQALGAVASVLGVGASRQAFMDDALFDPLTALYNRRYMDLTLPGELDRAKRYRSALSLLIIDVDHFKDINDTYGHLTGDRVLSEVSRVLERSIRRSDVPVRYGGDEFVLILPSTPVDGAKHIVDRVKDRLSRLTIGPVEGLTVSGGVAAARSDLDDATRFLHEADELLYRAKEAGRDMIEYPDTLIEFPAPPSHYVGRRH